MNQDNYENIVPGSTPSQESLFKYTKFPLIGDDGLIPCEQFLDASRSLVEFVSILGPVFIPVRSDINGNVDKLTTIYNTDKTKFATFNQIVQMEVGKESDQQIGTDALLWLTRALEYMSLFIGLLIDDYENGKCEDDLTPYFTQAYDTTLRKYHNWIVQNIVHLSLRATPSRRTIFNLLSPGIISADVTDVIQEKRLYAEMDEYRKLVDVNIKAVHRLFDSHKIEY